MRATRVLAVSCLCSAYGATALRAIRPPNDFAEAHWLLDYRFGFVRRGLGGALLRWGSSFGLDLHTEAAIAGVSYGTFVILSALLLAVALRIVARAGWDQHVVLLAAAWLTSPFVVTLGHLMGYLDQVVILLAVPAVWLGLRGRPWLAACVASAALFVHETALVVAVPALAFLAFMRPGATQPGWAGRVGRLAWLLPVAVFAAVAVADAAVTDQAALRKLLQLRLHRYPFVQGDMDIFVPEWLTTSLIQNVAAQWRHLPGRLTDSTIVLSVLPALQAVLVAAWAWVAPPGRRAAGLGVLVVACAPLALHVSAWDTARIWCLAVACAGIGLWVVAETRAFSPGPALGLAPVVALTVIVANVVGRIPLLDGQTERYAGVTLFLLYAPAVVLGLIGWVLDARRTGGTDA